MAILEVNNVSIRYMKGDFKEIGLKEYILRNLKGNYHVSEFWADRDISFTLEKGEMLGIIGSNGAGKSTLLKTLSGIMEPSAGSVHREGSIAALLELGSGFDGDLTVRENTYLRGAMMGYTHKFMDDTYEQIIDFAELKEFQDHPFKQLSSGMKSRLAFSIASLVKPDILILDEVLSVGDGAFRKKSEQKMREIIESGATTILVSHSLEQIREMCSKVLWLHKGKQIAFGDDVPGICDQYQAFLEGGELPSYGSEVPETNLDKNDECGQTPERNRKIQNVKITRESLREVPWAILLAVFVASVIFRGAVAAKFGEYSVFGDEFLHVKLAQSIASGNGLVIRGTPYDYTTCLYSLLISPVFLLTRNAETAHIMILWINAVLVSSAVFPIFFLARSFLKDRNHVWAVVAYGLLIGEMNYSMHVMQENLNYPLMMWFFLAFSHTMLEDRGNHLRNAVGLGAFAFLLSVCKSMNLAIILAVPLFLLVRILADKQNRVRVFKDLLTYTLVFFVLSKFYNFVMHIFLKNAVGGEGILSGNIWANLPPLNILMQLVCPAILYAVYTVLATGIFPLPLLIGNWKILPDKSQKMLTMGLCYIFVAIGAICMLITSRENPGTVEIRYHSRYFFYSFVLFVMLFLQLYEELKLKISCVNNSAVMVLLGCGAILLTFLKPIPMWASRVDGPSTDFLQVFRSSELLQTTLRCLLILLISAGIYFLYHKRIKVLYWVATIFFIFNAFVSFHYFILYQYSDPTEKDDALILNSFFSKEPENWNSGEQIMLLNPKNSPFECYLEENHRCAFSEGVPVGVAADFSSLSLISYHLTSWIDPNAADPQYIISSEDYYFQGYEEIAIGLENYHLYQRTGGEVKRVYEETGIYEDRWLGNAAATLELAGSDGCTSAELALRVDNTLIGADLLVNYSDSIGYAECFTIPATSEQTDIYVPIYKAEGELSYTVTLMPMQALQPDNGDNRQLSFRLFEAKIVKEK